METKVWLIVVFGGLAFTVSRSGRIIDECIPIPDLTGFTRVWCPEWAKIQIWRANHDV